MKQLRIPAVYMRGGTSKGVFFLAHDLPSDPAARDRLDSSRKTAPLVIAPDACVIDSSDLTVEGVVERIVEHLKTKGLGAGA